MIYPSFDEFTRLSRTAAMVPVALEMTGDLETPISLFLKLGRGKNSYILESVEGGKHWARYSYIGRNPFLIITAKDNVVTIVNRHTNTTTQRQGDTLEIIREIMAEYTAAKIEGLPDFPGGAVGYFAYDAARSFYKVSSAAADQPDPLGMPHIHLLVTDEVVVYDHVKQRIIVIVNVPGAANPEANYRRAAARLREVQEEIINANVGSQKCAFADDQCLVVDSESNSSFSTESRESFIKKVSEVKKLIEAGEVHQIVLSQRFTLPAVVDPFHAYRVLRSLNPSPYLFYINFGEYQLVGASPELLVKVTDSLVETCPIAGTRPRGRTAAEDQEYAEELLRDEKEAAEHLMLVDLGRDDIGKVAELGTVEVRDFMRVEKYSHVMHLVTTVAGRLRKDATMYDALKACLPAGTVSGAPKARAMEIIAELEKEKRGVYAGAVGCLGFNGNLDLCIAIRTIVFKDKLAFAQAGAGIVMDSDPEKEYEETLRKAKALLESIQPVEVNPA